jgi:RNA polymerase sigma-70 factor, ECF subfamily
VRTEVKELDQITLARAQRGDRTAFRALVELYQRPVHALIGRMMPPVRRADVEDLAQETFLRVYRALPEFEPRGPGRLSKWVLTIAARLAIDELRRDRPAPALIEQSEQVAGNDQADGNLHRRALGNAIAGAVAELSHEQRTVFLLREYHHFEYQEIANTLDLDLGTVKSRLSRARACLQVSLEELRHG